MPNLTGDSSGINLADPINVNIPNDGQPASIGSSLGVGAVFQRIANFIKALVVRGDGHNNRLLSVENLNLGTRVPSLESQMSTVRARTDSIGGNTVWHNGNLRIRQGSAYITPGTYINSLDMIIPIPGVQIGDFVLPSLRETVIGNRIILRGFVSLPNEVTIEIGMADSGSFQSGGGSSTLDNYQINSGQIDFLVIGT